MPSPTRSSSSRRRGSSAAEPRVEFVFWRGAPSWERALADLRAAMVELELDPGSISMHEVMSDADAEAVAFPGSPTIRVDGADVSEPRPDMPTGLVARMYLHRNRRIAPVPDPLDVRAALARASS